MRNLDNSDFYSLDANYDNKLYTIRDIIITSNDTYPMDQTTKKLYKHLKLVVDRNELNDYVDRRTLKYIATVAPCFDSGRALLIELIKDSDNNNYDIDINAVIDIILIFGFIKKESINKYIDVIKDTEYYNLWIRTY